MIEKGAEVLPVKLICALNVQRSTGQPNYSKLKKEKHLTPTFSTVKIGDIDYKIFTQYEAGLQGMLSKDARSVLSSYGLKMPPNDTSMSEAHPLLRYIVSCMQAINLSRVINQYYSHNLVSNDHFRFVDIGSKYGSLFALIAETLEKTSMDKHQLLNLLMSDVPNHLKKSLIHKSCIGHASTEALMNGGFYRGIEDMLPHEEEARRAEHDELVQARDQALQQLRDQHWDRIVNDYNNQYQVWRNLPDGERGQQNAPIQPNPDNREPLFREWFIAARQGGL